LRSGAHQQQWAVPGDGVRQQHPGGLFPGGLVQQVLDSAFQEGDAVRDAGASAAASKLDAFCSPAEELLVLKNQAFQVQTELSEQSQ
ncbi:unnamed protein product, partial [Tetraodon nigroviridis]